MRKSVAVLGGGPAGLYLARLLKLADRGSDVTVYERMDAKAQTFGFGVGLTESTMRNLAAADPNTAQRIRAASYVGHELRLRGRDAVVSLHGARNLAIGRAKLLEILTNAAIEVGVVVRHGVQADVASITADVVVAADGVGSSTREKYAVELGSRSQVGRSRFVWCGAEFAVDAAYFSAVEKGDSLFVAHAYPYAPDRSTFLIEVDDTTWQDSRLGELDRLVARGETDEASIAILQTVFADELGGRPLLTNRTRWSRFTELTLDRWSVDNVVLVGDAAHTAHYTLGSGTKLALEDSIALAQALTGESSIQAAFTAYEEARRAPVDRFKKLARRSQAWWDSYRYRYRWSADRLALSYMTRSGNLMLRDFAEDQPAATRRALAWLGDDVPDEAPALDDWVLRRPLRDDALDIPERWVTMRDLHVAAATQVIEWEHLDVWGEAADETAARAAISGGLPLLLTGPKTPEHVAARVDMAERLRLELDRPVGVALDCTERSLAATAIAAGRVDFAAHP